MVSEVRYKVTIQNYAHIYSFYTHLAESQPPATIV